MIVTSMSSSLLVCATHLKVKLFLSSDALNVTSELNVPFTKKHSKKRNTMDLIQNTINNLLGKKKKHKAAKGLLKATAKGENQNLLTGGNDHQR